MAEKINDGYTLTAIIPAVGECPAINLIYRPMTGPSRVHLLSMANAAITAPVAERMQALDDAALVSCQILARQIVSWDREEKPTAEALSAMEPEQFGVLENRITGWHRPQTPKDKPGEMPVDAGEEATVKN